MALTAYRPERPEVIRDTDVEKGFIAAFAPVSYTHLTLPTMDSV